MKYVIILGGMLWMFAINFGALLAIGKGIGVGWEVGAIPLIAVGCFAFGVVLARTANDL